MCDIHLKINTKSLRTKKQNHKQAYLVYLLKLKNKKNKQVIMWLKQTEVQIIHLKRSLFFNYKTPKMNKRRNSHTHAHTCVSYTTALHRRAVCPACCLLGIIHVWRTDWSPVPQHQLDTFPQVIVTADNERSHAPLGHSEGCQLGSRAVITKLHVYINMTHKNLQAFPATRKETL